MQQGVTKWKKVSYIERKSVMKWMDVEKSAAEGVVLWKKRKSQKA